MRTRRFELPVYYPIFLNIQGKKCVLVGGGKVALRKVRMLLKYGSEVTVISPKPDPGMVKLHRNGLIRLIQRPYRAGDVRGSTLVLAATDVEEINLRVAREAKKSGILVNVVDDPGASDFIVPSSFIRGDLTVAVSTSGMSPALAKKIRTTLEKNLGKEYASLVSLVSEVRSSFKRRAHAIDAEAWQEALDLDSLTALIRKGLRKRAKANLIKNLTASR